MFGSFGMQELIIIAVIALVIFGPSRLPQLGRSLGQSIREFRGVGKALTEVTDEVQDTVQEVQRNGTKAVQELRRP